MSAGGFGHEAGRLIRGFSARLAGRERGPDHDPEGKLRTPRRCSYDADDDPRAKPWQRVGDGSVRQGLAYREAMIETAEELHHEGRRQYPLRDIRDAQRQYDALSAELDAYTAGGTAPIGRPATIRMELARLRPFLTAAAKRMRRIDVAVLKALLKNIDFATGRLFPSIDTIADQAAVHRNSAIGALRRLKAHGFIEWVRRSVKTGNTGEFAPQREQTSNAYFFEHRQRMTSRVFQRYWQRVVAKLRRIGAAPPAEQPTRLTEASYGPLKAALASVGALLDAPPPFGNAST
ncbi:hypothetical protein [uncultured Sphingomonas sp.]|uniref:hypothetical protein n=1 Tax=uncultured Sphingomonas sp. TaxID=158754 RepID=UPI0025D49A65|nr:hypothetical protein [uncultured Sphingomonas sp.]